MIENKGDHLVYRSPEAVSSQSDNTGLCTVRDAVKSMREASVSKMEMFWYEDDGKRTNVEIEITSHKPLSTADEMRLWEQAFAPLPLLTLEQFNQKKLGEHEKAATYPKPNGIACPKCGNEMFDTDSAVLCSIPPQRNVHCNCGYKGYRYC